MALKRVSPCKRREGKSLQSYLLKGKNSVQRRRQFKEFLWQSVAETRVCSARMGQQGGLCVVSLWIRTIL